MVLLKKSFLFLYFYFILLEELDMDAKKIIYPNFLFQLQTISFFIPYCIGNHITHSLCSGYSKLQIFVEWQV